MIIPKIIILMSLKSIFDIIIYTELNFKFIIEDDRPSQNNFQSIEII